MSHVFRTRCKPLTSRGFPQRALGGTPLALLSRVTKLTSTTILFVVGLLIPSSARAAESLCDSSFQDCRAPLINLIRTENAGIDVGFWFMEDARYSNELIARFKSGVPVRVIMDLRANSTNPANADRLAELRAAGIPMRRRTAGGIMHYKLM